LKVLLESLTVKRGGRVIIRDLSATFTGPGLYQVMGPNGVGKTTLLLTILGLIKPVSGRVVVEAPFRNKVVFSYMPQSFTIPHDTPMTVYEFVEGALLLENPWPRSLKTRVKGLRVEKALESVNIPRFLWKTRISKLSTGMLQRALLARAVAVEAPIVLLDEPFSNIDPEGKAEVAKLLGDMSSERLVIVTSHDPTLLLKYTRKILLLGYGEHFYGDVDEVLKYEVLSKLYKECAVELEKHVHVVDWH